MAFEDRCSPNQATTPGPDTNRTSTPDSPNPNDRNLKPYTCTTMSSKYERSKVTNFPQIQNVSPLEIVQFNPLINAFHTSPIMYNPYYNPYIVNSLPLHPDYLRQIHQNGLSQQQQEEARKVKSMIARPEIIEEIDRRNQIERREPITDEQDDLHFSISNILKPEFGINAIRKTTNKKEGPKHGGPVHSILYKPYELAKSQTDPKTDLNTDNFTDYVTHNRNTIEDNSLLENRGESPFKTAPLGSLCNAVSQIGTKNFATKLNGVRSDATAKTGCNGFAGSKEDFSSIRRPDSANSSISTSSSNVSSQQGLATGSDDAKSGEAGQQWPAWVYCTRYSDRPSSGPRSRRSKKPKPQPAAVPVPVAEDKRPRTAFSSSQLARLKHEFAENRYLNERRRQQLSAELGLNEAQIKIWFQNKRAKIKKATGQKNPLALQLMAQGLYNHGTASCSEGEEEDNLIQVA